MTTEKSELKSNPLDNLTSEQRARLEKLAESVSFDKITVSFSIEDRDGLGRKKSSFFSVTASRGTGAEIPTMGEAKDPVGFTQEEAKIVRTLLSKHVVAGTYDDAMRRRVIPVATGQEECRAILQSYDRALAHLVAGKNGVGTNIGDTDK